MGDYSPVGHDRAAQVRQIAQIKQRPPNFVREDFEKGVLANPAWVPQKKFNPWIILAYLILGGVFVAAVVLQLTMPPF